MGRATKGGPSENRRLRYVVVEVPKVVERFQVVEIPWWGLSAGAPQHFFIGDEESAVEPPDEQFVETALQGPCAEVQPGEDAVKEQPGKDVVEDAGAPQVPTVQVPQQKVAPRGVPKEDVGALLACDRANLRVKRYSFRC